MSYHRIRYVPTFITYPFVETSKIPIELLKLSPDEGLRPETFDKINLLTYLTKLCVCLFQNKIFSNKSNDFENEALEVHNEYRREHGVPPLVLNKDISKLSQRWAEELARKDSMAYSLNKEYGESVYCGWSADPNTKVSAKDCVDKWYSEINDFSFGKEPEVLTCGHFTQIIWTDTKELGVGSAKSKSGKLYVVANYYPAGNYSGQFSKKVPPPGAHQFSSVSNNNRAPPSPVQRNSKNFATDLVSKLKSTSISGDKNDRSDKSDRGDKGYRFEEEFLNAHNEFRRKHGVPPLVLSKKLSKYAEEWAKTLTKKGRLEHRDQNDYGENIFYAWSSDPGFAVSGRDAVDKWYSEIKDHTFGREPSSLASGHFSQVVWEESKEVGVGIAKTKDGHIYVVANYFPPGNVVGSFAKNVPPPVK